CQRSHDHAILAVQQPSREWAEKIELVGAHRSTPFPRARPENKRWSPQRACYDASGTPSIGKRIPWQIHTLFSRNAPDPTFHPPAGIDPLAVVANDMSWGFLVAPVGIGAMLLTLFAFTWHKLVARIEAIRGQQGDELCAPHRFVRAAYLWLRRHRR